MPNSLKIATWNLQRPSTKGWKRNPGILQKIQEVNADIWIFTETNRVITPGSDYTGVASDYYNKDESCAAIWSRYPIKQQFPTFDSEIAACVEIASPIGNVIIYGTIITWAHDGVATGQAKVWEKHYQSIELHGEDWAKLNQPKKLFCVAGDFNECLRHPFHYGTKKGREMLTQQLQRNNLVCVTATNKIGYNIDHICLSSGWEKRVKDAQKWQGFYEENNLLSDHHGVTIELSSEAYSQGN